MTLFNLLACMAGLGAVAWIVFNLAVYAAPFFIGLSAAAAALHAGFGPIGAMAIGLAAGVFGLALIRLAYGSAPWLGLRLIAALIFMSSAVLAGWFAGRSFAPYASGAVWRALFAALGAIATGAAARMRLASWRATAPSRRALGSSGHFGR